MSLVLKVERHEDEPGQVTCHEGYEHHEKRLQKLDVFEQIKGLFRNYCCYKGTVANEIFCASFFSIVF